MAAHFINEDEHTTLATELLHELKASAKRWFIIAIIELVILVGVIAGFLWYISLPVEEVAYTTQTMDEISGDNVTQNAPVNEP